MAATETLSDDLTADSVLADIFCEPGPTELIQGTPATYGYDYKKPRMSRFLPLAGTPLVGTSQRGQRRAADERTPSLVDWTTL
jgi:hypothetical protein